MENDWKKQRNQIIGLGENSFKKSYYPELQIKMSELEASYANLQSVFDRINDGIVIHDLNGHIFMLNNQAKKIFNISSFGDLTVFDISDRTSNRDSIIGIWLLAMDGQPQTVDWIIKQRGTDQEVNVQITVDTTLWYGRKVLISTIRDFTDRIKFENELIIAKQKAEESDRLKSAFLQNMSHEIRTPMNAICGFSNLLGNPQLSEEKRNSFINIIQNSSTQLLSIVTDILTISALETQQEKINIQSTSINGTVLELFSAFKPLANNRKLTLDYQLHLSDDDSEIYTDKAKLSQILTNLLTNALKFTYNGNIEFGYERSKDSEMLQFYVKDSGIGIREEDHEKIFEHFRQADLTTSQKFGGTGLGLSISKAFVELLGGKIWLESEYEKGSTFFFTIPYQRVNQPCKPSSTAVQTSDHSSTILVAEDEEYNYLYIEELLKPLNVKVIHAKNGKEAIEIAEDNDDIALILMDIKMPIKNGYDAAVIIKELKPSLHIVAQSAYALDSEKSKYIDIFDEYITKPIKADELTGTVAKYIKKIAN